MQMFPTIIGDETDIKKWMADMLVTPTIYIAVHKELVSQIPQRHMYISKK